MQRVTKSQKPGKKRPGTSRRAGRTNASGAVAHGRAKPGKNRRLELRASAETSPSYVAFEEVLKYYRPRKVAITLRLDVDVLAWFKQDGRRYQTRINKALRAMMERELKAEIKRS